VGSLHHICCHVIWCKYKQILLWPYCDSLEMMLLHLEVHQQVQHKVHSFGDELYMAIPWKINKPRWRQQNNVDFFSMTVAIEVNMWMISIKSRTFFCVCVSKWKMSNIFQPRTLCNCDSLEMMLLHLQVHQQVQLQVHSLGDELYRAIPWRINKPRWRQQNNVDFF
jgi:hypothetical protein